MFDKQKVYTKKLVGNCLDYCFVCGFNGQCTVLIY